MKIYGDSYSGNCYKLKLLCSLLSLDYEWVDIDILKGECRTDAFLAINPAGQIPVCILDNGEVLTESNAILYYLAADSQFWPADKLAQARVLKWQFYEQYSHEPSIAVARFIMRYLKMPENRIEEYQSKLKDGYRALDLLERQLAQQLFITGSQFTIADISLYAYTHVAADGGFDLSRYPAIQAWLLRIAALPGYIPMAA
ncbi:MAG: glutathione S-transferase [Gammaproteobacteria bacterium]|jgi:glutathione S-transferase